MKSFTTFIRAFREDERGSMSIELLLVVPILLWVFLSTFVYFDVFRVQTNAVRATITLAELFSREDVVNSTYLNSAQQVLRTLTFEEANPDYRVTVYRYRESDDTFRRVWSRHRGFGEALTNADLADLKTAGRLPAMNEFDQNIYIETRTQYDAPFNIGLGPFTVTNLEDLTFTNDVVIRPRGTRLCFERNDGTTICGPGS
ncbi:TadE/TadG family type IV pilus assembly protein [Yoonia sp.]|uniref:TadE/TadG family type IV pilus assembly protein n=1 Tax=Yoonia sp. TaxID=2212373 RepID=UPI003974A33E